VRLITAFIFPEKTSQKKQEKAGEWWEKDDWIDDRVRKDVRNRFGETLQEKTEHFEAEWLEMEMAGAETQAATDTKKAKMLVKNRDKAFAKDFSKSESGARTKQEVGRAPRFDASDRLP
jgi:hypothetical protein